MNTIHPCIARALSGRHILIIGRTGSGKSFAASYMAQKMDCFVFVNTQQEKEITRVCQVTLEDPSELQDAMEEGFRAIEFVPSMDRETAVGEVETLREGLFEIGAAVKEQSNEIEIPFWISIFLDEVQLYTPKHTHKDAENFFTRGRGFGIKSIAISRQPQEISSEVINNCEFELIFQLGHYSEPYFRGYKIPIEEHKDWLSREYHFVLYDKIIMEECAPI